MRPFLPVAFLLILGVGCAMPVAESADDADPAKPEPLGCLLVGPPSCQAGTAPGLKVTLINRTGADIYLIRSLDASDCKWRLPYCHLEIIGPDGMPCDVNHPWCANVNTITAQDFVMVPAGGTFDPYIQLDGTGYLNAHQLRGENFQKVGAHRIRFVYSTKSEDIGRFIGWIGVGRDQTQADSDRIAEMFPKVPKVEARSNEIVVETFTLGK